MRLPLSLAIVLALGGPAIAQDKLYEPSVAPASNEPDAARQLIRRPKDVEVSLFASEPRLANPVAFTTDEKGRFFVVETFRLKSGVTDNRSHMYWLDDDLASKTVADRERMTRKWLGKEAESYAVEHDRIRLIEDRDGDHKADHDNVFADGFNQLSTGIGAGVLARKGDVYFACIPDLWLLKDTKGAGRADVRQSLSTGYGVKVSFLGHDLHGLIMGPDGRLYFSIGDRGLHVVTKEGKTLSCPDTGAVLRCEPDGSGLELFATGLRNPQELAFNDVGDLFTVDNNSDSGDKARVVHLVEGGDSGWRIGYQYIESPVSRGPWNAEKLWYPAPENTAAYLLPPLMNLSDGPSGLTFNPGVTLLPDRYKDRFLLADFRGGFGQSGIRSFAVEPKGASYKVIDSTEFAWSLLATDVDFGPDGALYATDWVDGWDKTGKGRIWRFADPKKEGDKAVAEVRAILSDGMSARTNGDLVAMLGHADRRVRQAAQFELADRAERELRSNQPPTPGEAALLSLERVTESSTQSKLVRLHALWGLAQVARRTNLKFGAFAKVKKDSAPILRAASAQAISESRPDPVVARVGRELANHLIDMLSDRDPRVVATAARGLGRLREKSGTAPLLDLLVKNADADVTIRHSAMMGLVGIGDVGAMIDAANRGQTPVRLGVVLALRRLKDPRIARFLDDPEPRIVLETARAIYDDDPTNGPGMVALAKLAARPNLDEPTARRAINANARLGGVEQAERLRDVASTTRRTDAIQVEALELLADWGKPSGRDRVTGLWRPYPARPIGEAVRAVRGRLEGIILTRTAIIPTPTRDRNVTIQKSARRPGVPTFGPEAVRHAAIRAAGALKIEEALPTLIRCVGSKSDAPETQVEAIRAIEQMGTPRLGEAVDRAIDPSAPAEVRREGQRLLATLDPARAVRVLGTVLGSGSTGERQGALSVLAGLNRPDADALIASHLTAKDLPGEVELDLLDAVEARKDSAVIKAALDARSLAEPKNDPLAGYRAILLGGDARRGRQLFERNTAVHCVRCHKVKGEGGEVGPDLTGIGAKQTREYLATSIVHPNAAIAQGFETVIVATADGKVVSGVFKSEDDKTLRLMSVDNKPIDVPKSEIDDRKRGPSAMPEDVARKLKKSDLRDLVEFLATLR